MSNVDLQGLLDERDIEQVLIRYAMALDEREWAGLDEVFVPEASGDYGAFGQLASRDSIVAMVRTAIERCGRTQHLLGNVRIVVDGNKATAKCYLQAIHAGLGAYEGKTFTVYGEYRDRLEHRAEGWRIVHRQLVVLHVEGDIGLAG